MQMVRTLILIAIGCFAAHGAFAQTPCTATGLQPLVCIVPFTTGAFQGNGAQAAKDRATLFNGPIAAQLSQLPLATSAPGGATLYKDNKPVPYDNLGPILLDRPDGVGKGRVVLGFSFQHFNFNHLDGIDITSIPFVFQQTSPGTTLPQYIYQNEKVGIQLNQYVALLTFGLAKNTDLSVIVPFSNISIAAFTTGKSTYTVQPDNTITVTSVPDPAPGTPPTSGSANGLGDVTLNFKRVLWAGGKDGKGGLAAGIAMRLPTGDALNYLGSGAYGFNLYALASYKARFSPHAKFAYQWNTSSVLLNLNNTPGANRSLPGGAQYGIGMDVAAMSRLTISSDILANEFTNSPYIQPTTTCVSGKVLASCTTGSNPVPTVYALSDISTPPVTYTTADLSFGIKYKPIPYLIMYGNVLVQMKNVGLRADPSPSFGISYSFRSPITGKGMHKWLDR